MKLQPNIEALWLTQRQWLNCLEHRTPVLTVWFIPSGMVGSRQWQGVQQQRPALQEQLSLWRTVRLIVRYIRPSLSLHLGAVPTPFSD